MFTLNFDLFENYYGEEAALIAVENVGFKLTKNTENIFAFPCVQAVYADCGLDGDRLK